MNTRCRNVLVRLNRQDRQLVERTKKLMKKHYQTEKHPVITGILDSDGKMFFGLSNCSPSGISICAEPAAISQAVLQSKTGKLKTIVSLRGKLNPPKIISPCGTCRELLRYHYPNINVVVLVETGHQSVVKKIKSKYLLPFPYYKLRLNEKNAFVKDTWCAQGHDDPDFEAMIKTD